jgi:serine/threonine protein phosphatase PrpC
MSQEDARGMGAWVRAAGRSDVGRVRSHNEDSLMACDLSSGERRLGPFDYDLRLGPKGLLLGVADGMGGEAGGELASQICVEEVSHRLLAGGDEREAGERLRRAIEAANERIRQEAQRHPAYQGMGTTITAALLRDSSLWVAQVGDSRAYLVRDREARLLTRDQTLVNYLADLGAEWNVEGENDPRRNILIQAVGTSAVLDVELTRVRLLPGDLVLVCSDGLSNWLQPAELVEVLAANEPLARRCQALIDRANARGGPDNITAVVAQFDGCEERCREGAGLGAAELGGGARAAGAKR